MKALTRLNAFASGAGAFVGGLAVVVMAAFILYEIALRYFFDTSSFMMNLVVGHAVQAVIFCSLGYSFTRGVHIRITLFTMRLPRAVNTVLELFALLLTGAVFSFVGWYLLRDGLKQFDRGAMTDTLIQVPVWISNLIIVSGLLVFLLAVVTRFLTVLVSGRVPEETPGAGQI